MIRFIIYPNIYDEELDNISDEICANDGLQAITYNFSSNTFKIYSNVNTTFNNANLSISGMDLIYFKENVYIPKLLE